MKISITKFYFNMVRYRFLSHVCRGKKKSHYKSKYKKIAEIFNKAITEYNYAYIQRINIQPVINDEILSRVERFINEQMPTLLENYSQMNSRLINLEKSVPVAFRKITRASKQGE